MVSEVWKRYAIEGWPTLVLINPDGKIIGRLSDERAYASLDPILAKAVPYFADKGRLHPSTVHGRLKKPAGRTRCWPIRGKSPPIPHGAG